MRRFIFTIICIYCIGNTGVEMVGPPAASLDRCVCAIHENTEVSNDPFLKTAHTDFFNFSSNVRDVQVKTLHERFFFLTRLSAPIFYCGLDAVSISSIPYFLSQQNFKV